MHRLSCSLCFNFKYLQFIHIWVPKNMKQLIKGVFFNYLQNFVNYMSKTLLFMLRIDP